MKKLIGHIVLFSLIISACWAASSDVQTIHYQSKKTSKLGAQVIQSEMLVWMSSQNVRIAISVPEKRDIALCENVITIIAENTDTETLNYTEAPMVLRQLLVPSIFSAGSFMQNVTKGFNAKLVKTDDDIQYYTAESKRKKNISKVEYVFDSSNNTLISYKMYALSGALMSEAHFYEYKLYADKFMLPGRIKTMTTIQDGVLEDEEVFSRLKVNAPVDENVFQLKGGDK